MRILQEAIGMASAGMRSFWLSIEGGGLIGKARARGFTVYELSFCKKRAIMTIPQLLAIFKKHSIDLIITHSSLDAWIGGLSARIAKKRIIRTRHLSTPIRSGLNSFLLYKCLVDFVVTTSSCILPMISERAKLDLSRLKCIPTGIDRASLRSIPHLPHSFALL